MGKMPNHWEILKAVVTVVRGNAPQLFLNYNLSNKYIFI